MDKTQWVGKYKMRPGPTYAPPVDTSPASKSLIVTCLLQHSGTNINKVKHGKLIPDNLVPVYRLSQKYHVK